MITQDLYDVLDFTDNEIKKLENFPRFSRLSTLLLSNNHISRIGPQLGEQLANLETVILSNNRIESLSEVDHLKSCEKLAALSLVGNPVTRRQHYRLYVINALPSVKVLDFMKVPRLLRCFRNPNNRLQKLVAGKTLASRLPWLPPSLMPSLPPSIPLFPLGRSR